MRFASTFTTGSGSRLSAAVILEVQRAIFLPKSNSVDREAHRPVVPSAPLQAWVCNPDRTQRQVGTNVALCGGLCARKEGRRPYPIGTDGRL